MLFDLPLEELKKYKPVRDEPRDFDAFWVDTLKQSCQYPLDALFEPYDRELKLVECLDVTFNGYAGQPIKGWLILPKAREGRLPCVIEYIGYGGGRGFPIDWLLWSSAGYAHFVMDTRGQGSVWRRGDTPDLTDEGSSPQVPGFMSRGVLDPNTYYYRRLFTDAVRAVEAARSHPAIDPGHIAVTGSSQGGGITLAVAGLVPEIKFAMPDVPFLCHIKRAVEITDKDPYHEIVRFCKTHRDKIEVVFKTLSYFDGMNFAVCAKAEALFSVGLMDTTCPPSTVFAAYNHYAGKKDIRVWKFNEHEGGEQYQALEKLQFLKKHWG